MRCNEVCLGNDEAVECLLDESRQKIKGEVESNSVMIRENFRNQEVFRWLKYIVID